MKKDDYIPRTPGDGEWDRRFGGEEPKHLPSFDYRKKLEKEIQAREGEEQDQHSQSSPKPGSLWPGLFILIGVGLYKLWELMRGSGSEDRTE